jgi:UDP-2-acetamido-2-deoxy-ribo-hexuluronate aminotransferase
VPLYRQPALAQSEANCPQSDRAADEVLSLPMHAYLGEAVQDRVSRALVEALSCLLVGSDQHAGAKV